MTSNGLAGRVAEKRAAAENGNGEVATQPRAALFCGTLRWCRWEDLGCLYKIKN